MSIGIVGATGLVGVMLRRIALRRGYSLVCFSRSSQVNRKDGEEWRLLSDSIDLSGIDVLVNLAGESIAQRWSKQVKKALYFSRVDLTKLLVNEMAKLSEADRPRLFINASAVGYYGNQGERELDEQSAPGQGFLADLCVQWEREASKAEALGIQVVFARLGMVLANKGLAWKRMRFIFSWGLGGRLGSGKQWMPWVNVRDVVGALLYVIQQGSISGPVNIVSPNPMTNIEFTKAVAEHVGVSALFPVPPFVLKAVFGEFGGHLLESFKVYPRVLEDMGYVFLTEDLRSCMVQVDSEN